MEHTDLTGFLSSAFSTGLPGHSPYQLATFLPWYLGDHIPLTAISYSQLSNSTSLSASSLLKDSIQNCSLFLTSQHIRKAKAFGRSQDQNHLQQLTTQSLHLTPTGSAAASDHSLAALISPRSLQNLPSSSHSMHWLDGAAQQDWWIFWILWGRKLCYIQVDCSLIRMRIISKYARFCHLYLRNQICIN